MRVFGRSRVPNSRKTHVFASASRRRIQKTAHFKRVLQKPHKFTVGFCAYFVFCAFGLRCFLLGPLVFFERLRGSAFCVFSASRGALGPSWRIVGGARFGPPYRRDLLRLGLFGAPGPQCWYFLLLRRPCEGFLLRGAEIACFCAPDGLKQGSHTVKHL